MPSSNGALLSKPAQSLVVAVLLLRSQLLKGPKAVIAHLQTLTSKERVTPEALAEALQQLYVDDPDGNKTLLVPTKSRIDKVSGFPLIFGGPHCEAVKETLASADVTMSLGVGSQHK